MRRSAHTPPRGLDAMVHDVAGVAGRARLAHTGFLRRGVSIAHRADALDRANEGALSAALSSGLANVRVRPDDALAILARLCVRTLRIRPRPTQLAAALAMHRDAIVELATGEGKTLAAALTAILHAATRGGCHVFTSNDYLARRDARAMAPLVTRAGFSVGFIVAGMTAAERRAAYRAHITYTTVKETVADRLRDRAAGWPDGATARRAVGLTRCADNASAPPLIETPSVCAIVDEADDVLIDEAQTPVILSRPASLHAPAEALRAADRVASGLRAAVDFSIDHRHQRVRLHRGAATRIASARPDGLTASRWHDLVATAVRARALFHRGTHYLVQDGRIVLIDQGTGRPMPDRTLRDGLHEALEIANLDTVHAARDTVGRMSVQRFFASYARLAGMTGTAWEVRRELWRTYALPVVRVPPHKTVRRTRLTPVLAATRASARRAAAREAARLADSGRPTLIGTTRLIESRAIADELAAAGSVAAAVLNAEHHEAEARLIERAGEAGRVTVATNMAGRGADIVLSEPAREAGGLHVLLAEASPSRRLERQLFGRAARAGDPGSARAIRCADDPLVRRFAPVLAALARRFALLTPLATARARAAAERQARANRRRAMISDEEVDEMLFFAAEGPSTSRA